MIGDVDPQQAAKAIEAFLTALGLEPSGELAQTGQLVARAWCEELLSGYQQDPVAILEDGALDCNQPALVLLRSVAVSSMCPHHLLPSHGFADIAYLPTSRVAGFGAITRALDACARRLVLQEECGAQLTAAMIEALGARGALCRLRMTHTCMLVRGPRQASALIDTLSCAGSFARGGEDRQMAMTALGPVTAPGEADGER